MMAEDAYILQTGRDGQLVQSMAAEDGMGIGGLRSARHVVLHLHGGLVDEASGLRTARRLTDVYKSGSGAFPVFVVWQSGLLEVLSRNLAEIAGEALFTGMRKRVLQFVVGKLWQEEGERAAGALPIPNDVRVNGELAKGAAGGEPFEEVAPDPGLSGVDRLEREELERAVQADRDVIDGLDEVLAGRHPESIQGSRDVVERRVASPASLIDPEVLDEIDAGPGGERGVFSMAVLAKKCGAVLVRVIERFRAQTDHGVCAAAATRVRATTRALALSTSLSVGGPA
jgi:hypothetical protein